VSRARILVVEDDPDIRELMAHWLGREGYEVVQAATAEAGLASAAASPPDLVVLDVMLPGMDGLEALRRLKAEPTTARTPVLMASARGEDPDVVAGLELGADDYVTKPFSPRVLVARVRAALRRRAESSATHADAPADAPLERGDIALHATRHELRVAGAPVELTATEFALLELLMREPGRVFSRARIIDAVRGGDYPVTDRAVDVHVLALRKKLGARGEFIETVRGVGYRFREVC